MSLPRLAAVAVAALLERRLRQQDTEQSDPDPRDVDDPPTHCRECGERERTYNTFRCPGCHSEMTEDDHPPLASEVVDVDDDEVTGR